MQERLQKIIARAGIASRRHAEQLILSGQVRVNGRVVTELGTKADAEKDRVEVAGRAVEAEERRVYLLVNKPPEVMSTLADPEGRRTLKNLLRGFPSRVYPVGNLEYASSGLVFMTNDGDLAAELLKKWEHLEQIYYAKIKGMLTLADLERVGKEAGVKMQTLRQPGAARGHGANYWYEVTMRDSKLEALRRVLFKEKHPLEKLKRVALGPLTIEGIAPGRYRLLQAKEAQTILAMKPATKKFTIRQEPTEREHARPVFRSAAAERSLDAMASERLQKILAAAGVASRRAAEEIISAGRVAVNGTVVTELGTKADPEVDEIFVDGKPLRKSRLLLYFVLNKPKGYVTTVSDPEGRKTVMDLISEKEERVYPVGRLDYASEGLLLLTNDGALAQMLTKAGSHVPKTYLVKISGRPSEKDIARLRAGISIPLEDGRRVKTSPARIRLTKDEPNPWYEVILIEGRNRQIRRMFKEIGFDVEKIKRVKFGPLKLDVEPGQYRLLTVREVAALKAAAGSSC